MVPCGDVELIADQMASGFDAPSYLRAMDAQGIDAVVLYPVDRPVRPVPARAGRGAERRRAGRTTSGSPATARGRDPHGRRRPRAAGRSDTGRRGGRPGRRLGLVGVLARPNHLYGRNLGDAAYDPLYAALAEAGLVLAVHEGLGLRGPTIGADRFAGFTARHLLSHPMEQMAAMASLVLDGALARHPALRVAFLESGTGWLPYWLHRLDEHQEWMDARRGAGVGPLRPAVRDLHRGRRRPHRPGRRTGSGPTTSSGPATSPIPTPCSLTRPRPSWPRPEARASPTPTWPRSSGTARSPSTPSGLDSRPNLTRVSGSEGER